MTDTDYMNRVEAMERRLYRVSRAILWNDADCADVIQETVIRGWLKRDSLRNPDYFETWMTRILINECRTLQRKNRLKTLPPEENTAEASLPDPAEDLLLNELLGRLPAKHRTVLVLHHVEGFSLEDIADLLKIPQTTVKSRLHQARKALRELLSTGDDMK